MNWKMKKIENHEDIMEKEIEELGREIKPFCSRIHIVNSPTTYRKIILFIEIPKTRAHAAIIPGMFVIESSAVLKGIYEKMEHCKWYSKCWKCAKRGTGRLKTSCCFSGFSQKSTRCGERLRISKKVRCIANVPTVPLSSHT